MRAVIGNSLLSQLKPKLTPYDIWDEKLTGFILRVLPTGKMVYRCEYARGKRITIGTTKAVTPQQARDRVKEILGQVALGLSPGVKQNRDHMTLLDFIKSEYEPWRLANRKNGKADLKRLAVNFLNKLGSCALSEISPILIDKWRTSRINNGIRIATVNRDIVILKAALSKAVEWDFISEHPLRNLKLHKVDSAPKIRYLSKEEESALKSAIEARENKIRNARNNANQWRKVRGLRRYLNLEKRAFADHLTPMVLLSLNTGLRRGELFGLSWENIDLDKSILTISGDSAKSGKTRHIPLNTIALEVLYAWRNQTKSKGIVFINSDTEKPFDNVTKAWNGILATAGILNFRWHDMRHHFASKLVMKGVDLNTVRELLGHTDIKMTLRYAHLAPKHKANAVAKLVETE